MGKVVIYSGQWWIEKSPTQDFSPNLLSMLEAWPSSVQGFYFPSLSNHKYLLTLQGNLLVSFSFFFFTHSFLISEVYLGLGWHGRYTVPLCHYSRDHFVTAHLKA